MAALDHKTVQAIRAELEAGGEIPHTTERYSRDGRSQDVSEKEQRSIETELVGPEEDAWTQDEDEPVSDINDSDIEDEEAATGEEEFDDEQRDKYPQLVCIDGVFPDELPVQVYEVNKDKASIVRRKVDRQDGDNYILANGKTLPKAYGHLTWLEAHDMLLAAVQGDQEAKADDIEDLAEERKELLAELKKLESQIAAAKKEKEKLDLRLKKVEGMEQPKGAEVETEEAIA
jgi:hypothetical protein